MRLSPSTLTTLLTSATLSTARITGLSAPSTIAPGQPFNITLIGEIYIQSVTDVGVAWGYTTGHPYPYSLGSWAATHYIPPEHDENFTIAATAPGELEEYKGKGVVLSASVYSLYGEQYGPMVLNTNVTVKVGDETGGEEVASRDFYWGTGNECS